MKKVLSILLALVILAVLPVTASATTTTNGTGVFTGYDVVVLDSVTPAVTVWDDMNSTASTFYSVDGKALGSISPAAYMAIMEKYNANQTGTGPHLPPDGSGDWQLWFAEQFNIYRGLSAGVGTQTTDEYMTELIKEYRQEIIRLVNVEREKEGLHALYINDTAMEYAQMRAAEIFPQYSHTRPDGSSALSGISGACGENIGAFMGDGNIAEQAVNSWMNSPGHRANILNEHTSSIGVGIEWNGDLNFRSYRLVQIFMWD